MQNNWKNILIIILVLVSCFLAGYIIYQVKNPVSPEETKITLHDTITLTNTVHDTLIVEKVRYKTKYDTVFTRNINIDDSVYQVTDTLSFDVEHKEASFSITDDSLTIKTLVFYQGINTKIDSVQTVYDFNYTVKQPVQKQRRFNISLTAGYYTGYNLIDNKIYSGPGAGISIGIRLY